MIESKGKGNGIVTRSRAVSPSTVDFESAMAQALVVARTEVELVGSACIVVRGSGIGGVRLCCTLVSCIVVSEWRSIRFIRTCTAVLKEGREGKGKEGKSAYMKRRNHRHSWP